MTGAGPTSLLFACNMNSVRSPLAEGLARKRFGDQARIESCGLRGGFLDPYMVAVLAELDIDMSAHEPRGFAEVPAIEEFQGIIAFTESSYQYATRRYANDVTFIHHWQVIDPSAFASGIADLMDRYRALRDQIGGQLAQLEF